MRSTVWIASLLLASGAAAETGSFLVRPVAPEVGVATLSRDDAERLVGRSLFAEPASSAVYGDIHIYNGFPYIQARTVHVTSDARWQRLLYGEPGEAPRAFGHAGTGAGEFGEPHGLAFAPDGRLFVADRALGRVTVLRLRWEANGPQLDYVGQVDGLVQPMDVAVHDGGTPADPADDRLLVAEAGAQRIALFDLSGDQPVRLAEYGSRGSSAGEFLYPRAVGVGRRDGVCDDAVYVADSGNHRLVELTLRGTSFEWSSTRTLPMEATSIDTDHYGNVYVAMRRSGNIVKMSPQLEELASWDGGDAPLAAPRDVAIPFAWVHDHRTNAAPAWRGQGTALVLERWGDATGVRRLDLGVEITDVARRGDTGVEMLLTDAAHVAAQVVSKQGDVATVDLGERLAGRQHIDLPALADAAQVRIVATSDYDPERRAESTLDLAAVVPARLELRQNVPNPFNPTTTIEFSTPAAGSVRLAVYDVSGRRVRTLVNGVREAGSYQIVWDGRDERGLRVGSGVYFYKLDAREASQVRKMVLAQ
jgi:FlgD Ig-like domain